MTLAPWNEEAWRKVAEPAQNGRLAHALLLTGADGLGKRAFAERLAALLLCEQPESAPCGRCRSCELFAKRVQHDPEETRPDGTLAQPHGYPGHPDAMFVGYVFNEKASPKKMYSSLVVEQIRDLSAWFGLTPRRGRAQVALIDPADALNEAAANALLKTLEEPNSGRYLILVSAFPARLAATIRSRCQRIEFRVPGDALARQWLQKNGVDDKVAQEALVASDGNPGLALAWSRSGAIQLRGDVAKDLHDLGAGLAQAWDVAQRWSRDQADLRLRFAAALAQRQGRASVQGSDSPLALTTATDLPKLALWFDQVNRTRDLLRGPLRPELALLEVLSAWNAGQGGTGSKTERI